MEIYPTSRVKVFVRYKPRSKYSKKILISNDTNVSIDDKVFQFDRVFNEDVSQQHVYEYCAQELVNDCFKGFNGTVLAYGQTV